MPDTAILRAVVTADTASAEAKLSSVGKTIQGLGGVGKYAFAALAAGVATFAAVSVKAYSEHQRVVAQLQNQLSRMPKLAGETTKAFEDQATALQNLTGYEDEQILAADTVLSRFELTGKQIRDTIPIVLDYARASGKDVPAAAAAVGKAVLGNSRALKEMGIQFTATGNRAKDFNSVLELLKSRVGGTADAFGKTFEGQLEIFKAQLNDVEEAAGKALLPTLTTLLHAVTDLLGPFKAVAQYLPQIILGFLAFKAVTFVPELLFAISRGLSLIAATGASDAVLSVAAGAEGLGAALGAVALPALIAVGGALLLMKAGADAANARISAAEQTIIQFGSSSKQSATAIDTIAASESKWVGSPGFRALGHATTDGQKLSATLADLDAKHRQLAGAIGIDAGAMGQLAQQSSMAASELSKQRDAILSVIAANLQAAGGFLGIRGAQLGARSAQLALIQAQNQYKADLKDGHVSSLQLKQDLLGIKQAQLNAVTSQQSLAASIVDYADKQIKAGVSTANVIDKVRDFARAAGLSKKQTDALVTTVSSLIAKDHGLPKFVRTQYQSPGLAEALAGTYSLNQALNILDGRMVNAYVITHYSSTGTPGTAGGIQGSRGLVFPGYAAGTAFMGPRGPFVAGEGSYPTRFGTGGEIVNNRGVLPLNDRIISKLGEAIAGRGGGGHTFVFNFHGPVGGAQAWAREAAPAIVRELDRRVAGKSGLR